MTGVKKINKVAFFLFLTFFLSVPIYSAELHVGSGQAYSTVASGIAASSGGDTIVIHSGTYNEKNLRPKGNTTLKGATGESKPIIDGQQTAYTPGTTLHVFRMYNVNDVTLDGLDIRNGGTYTVSTGGGEDNITIKNCYISVTWGVGKYANDNAACIVTGSGTTNIVIQNNVLTANNAGVHGVLIWQNDGSAIIENNFITLSGDHAGRKGCIGVFYKHAGTATTQLVVRDNLIRVLGSATGNGGIWIVNDNTLIHNNLIFGSNSASMRDGIKVFGSMGAQGGSDCIITHNTVYGATTNGVLHVEGNGGRNNIFRNNIFYGGTNEFRTFTIWHNESAGSHGTIMDYNNYYYPLTDLKPIREFGVRYSLQEWKNNNPDTIDAYSTDELPVFKNTSGNMSFLEDFEIVGGVANNGASDGTDMGVDINLVGTGIIEVQDSLPPAAPQNVRVE